MGHPPHFETTRHHKQSEAKRHNILRFAIFNHSLRWHIICGCLISCSKKKKHGGGATGATMKNNKPRHILDWSVIILTFQTSNFEEMATLCDEGRLGTLKKLESHWCPPNLAWWKLAGLLAKTWSKMVKNPCSIHWHLWFFCKLQIWF